jgi:hypothetical protein
MPFVVEPDRHSLAYSSSIVLRMPEPMIWTGYALANWKEEGPWGEFSLRMCIDVQEENIESD